MSKPPIHCLMDCLALAVKTATEFDPRPAYLGIWNAPFLADENGFRYYSETIDPDTEFRQFESLYGNGIQRWNDPTMSKDDHYRQLVRHSESAARFGTVVTLVDLYYMPYSAICYRQKHLPHIVIVRLLDNGDWYVRDPFFEWEGNVANAVLQDAHTCERLSAGVTVDGRLLRAPGPVRIARTFREQLSMDESPLVAFVDAYLRQIAEGVPGYSAQTLYASIGQVGIVAKRWKAFGLVGEYFSDQGGGDSRELEKTMESLMLKWENFVLTIVRLGVLGKHEKLADARIKLGEIAALERETKLRLQEIFEKWEAANRESIA
ncbi:DUF6005 family protein [Cohnella sp. GCM10027633]|uniref:DUF6005 family protein n=1 Tax=unclassified Cohnella TaxID=2636738 RepID=UPI003624BE4F